MVVPSLRNSLGFNPFLILCHDILKLIKTRSVLCCDRGKIVATSNVMFKFTYVATMRNIVAIETFLAISESKVDYVMTQKKVCRDKKI